MIWVSRVLITKMGGLFFFTSMRPTAMVSKGTLINTNFALGVAACQPSAPAPKMTSRSCSRRGSWALKVELRAGSFWPKYELYGSKTWYLSANESGNGSLLLATIATSSTPSLSKSAVITGVGKVAGNMKVAPNCCLTSEASWPSAGCGALAGAGVCPPAMHTATTIDTISTPLLMSFMTRVYLVLGSFFQKFRLCILLDNSLGAGLAPHQPKTHHYCSSRYQGGKQNHHHGQRQKIMHAQDPERE